uniref:Methyltransf_21 domain-containing protein n=1 Tax=Panagrellus redivivus TaxID=6233 RepID=A0A7E4W9A2_PANRE
MKHAQYIRYFAVFVFSCVVLYFIIPSSNNVSSVDQEAAYASRLTKYSALRTCQLNGPTTNAKEFAENYQSCIEKHLPKTNFEYFNMGRFHEKKVFLPLVKESSAAQNCNFLTIGIGGDVLVETEFKLAHPECKIFGVEASPDQVAGFEEFGTVIPYGVGVKNETINLVLRKAGKYVHKDVEVVAMQNLLDRYLGTRFVHYATIDIEGAEYAILKALLSGNALYNEGIVVCQIDAELHGFNADGSNIIDLMKAYAVETSQYIPVANSPFLTHQKVTFVNVENERCREAFNLDTIGI